MSMPTRSALTPNCSLSRVWSATSAACSSALVGMQARAAQLGLVDQGDRQVELGRAQGGGVPSAAGAEDDDVEVSAVRLAHADSSGRIVAMWVTQWKRSQHVQAILSLVEPIDAARCPMTPPLVVPLRAIEREERRVAWFRRRS